MPGIEDLMNKIIQAHLRGQAPAITTGTVKDVDESNYTCTVEREDRPDLVGVRLNACEYEGNRFVLIPSDDAVVLVCMIEGDQAEGLVVACSDIKKILALIGEAKLVMTESGVQVSLGLTELVLNAAGIQITGAVTIAGSLVINQGALGGLPKLQELTDNLNSIKDFTTAMKSAVVTALQQIPNGGSVASLNFNTAMANKVIEFKDMANEDLQQ